MGAASSSGAMRAREPRCSRPQGAAVRFSSLLDRASSVVETSSGSNSLKNSPRASRSSSRATARATNAESPRRPARFRAAETSLRGMLIDSFSAHRELTRNEPRPPSEQVGPVDPVDVERVVRQLEHASLRIRSIYTGPRDRQAQKRRSRREPLRGAAFHRVGRRCTRALLAVAAA